MPATGSFWADWHAARAAVKRDVMPGEEMVVITAVPGGPPIALSMSEAELRRIEGLLAVRLGNLLPERTLLIRHSELQEEPCLYRLAEPLPLGDGWWQVNLTPVEDT